MTEKTFLLNPKAASADRKWHHIDAHGQILGRMATRVATLLRGKQKVVYTNFVDCGDFVVVTNAKHIRLTGKKLAQKEYFSHSGYAGGAKVTPMWRLMEKDPCRIVMLAVKRMLPNNKLRSRQLTRLRIFAEDKHPFNIKAQA